MWNKNILKIFQNISKYFAKTVHEKFRSFYNSNNIVWIHLIAYNEPSVNRKVLKALTLVGLPWENPKLDP